MTIELFDDNKTFLSIEGDRVVGQRVCNYGAYRAYVAAGEHLIESDKDPALYYLKKGTLTLRPTQDTTLSGSRLDCMPTPWTLYINGTEYSGDTRYADLDIDQPGVYSLLVVSWPYLEKEFSFENPAS